MISLLLIPFTSFFLMMIMLSTYGEIIENKNGLEEYWIIVYLQVLFWIAKSSCWYCCPSYAKCEKHKEKTH
tara:strand:+ start:4931 stop:5143 length:213 start_codon:yes stop_codon:yes gene_type:complete